MQPPGPTLVPGVFLNITPGHCDLFFSQARIGNGDEEFNPLEDKNGSLILPLVLGVAGGLFFILASGGIFIFFKCKKNVKKIEEDVDINPDYGYEEEGHTDTYFYPYVSPDYSEFCRPVHSLEF